MEGLDPVSYVQGKLALSGEAILLAA